MHFTYLVFEKDAAYSMAIQESHAQSHIAMSDVSNRTYRSVTPYQRRATLQSDLLEFQCGRHAQRTEHSCAGEMPPAHEKSPRLITGERQGSL